jgi:hypothetical protein
VTTEESRRVTYLEQEVRELRRANEILRRAATFFGAELDRQQRRYWGLHCFPEPRAAIEEAARVLRPGGRLVGCCFVRGNSLRQRLQLRPHTTDFGSRCTEPELLEWLAQAGLRDVSSRRSGLFMFFNALRP